jgi:bifunctional DNase/RNase
MEVIVSGVIEDQQLNTYVVLLKEKHGERTLPIWIGENEAMAIAVALEGIKSPRPMTHDLIKIIIDAVEARFVKTDIVDLNNETYYAKIYIETDGKLIGIDARPSDSIALALRANSVINVHDEIMNKNGVVFQGDTVSDEFKRRLRGTKPEEFGKYDLK